MAEREIFIFVNGRLDEDIYSVALCECGTVLAGHVSSHVGWAAHDMGITGSWKHEKYDAHFREAHPGDDWTLVDLLTSAPQEDAGWLEACAKNQATAEGGGQSQPQNSATGNAT